MKPLPRFEIVNLKPEEVAKTPPLASALQSFETSIFLLGLRRYPAALVACCSAIESAIKAIPGYPQNTQDGGLQSAIDFAQRKNKKLKNTKIHELRRARNTFSHYGYSPGDDGVAAELLIGVGYPFLSQCLYEFHKISLRTCLINDIWGQVEAAKSALNNVDRATHNASEGWQTSLCKAIEHTVMTSLRNPADEKWTDIYIRLSDHEYEEMNKFKNKLESIWNFYTYVKCPISTCIGSDCLVGLDLSKTHKLEPIKIFCFDCRFSVDENGKELIKILIGKTIEQQKTIILREYGLQ